MTVAGEGTCQVLCNALLPILAEEHPRQKASLKPPIPTRVQRKRLMGNGILHGRGIRVFALLRAVSLFRSACWSRSFMAISTLMVQILESVACLPRLLSVFHVAEVVWMAVGREKRYGRKSGEQQESCGGKRARYCNEWLRTVVDG